MSKHRLWYTRRNNQIRGPFPAGMITRYILLGRIKEDDELSEDQIEWFKASSLEDLIPEELKLDLSLPENQERLKLARQREDERQYGDRRTRRANEADDKDDLRYKRTGEERRGSESVEALQYREFKTHLRKSLVKPKPHYTWPYFIIVIVIGGLVVFSFMHAPRPITIAHHCNATPASGVNWNNCRFEGIVLSHTNLSDAKIRNAFLIGADFDTVNLSHADLSYSNFINARIINSHLSDAKLVGTLFRNTNLAGSQFKNSNLSYAIMQGANLSEVDLSNSNLTHVDFNGANIRATNFSGAILDKAIWIDNSVCSPESVGRCIPIAKAK